MSLLGCTYVVPARWRTAPLQHQPSCQSVPVPPRERQLTIIIRVTKEELSCMEVSNLERMSG